MSRKRVSWLERFYAQGETMIHLKCPILAVLSLVASVGATESGSRSAVLTFPAGATELHAVFNAANDLLKRDYTIDASLVDQRLEASVTYYDQASAFRSGLAKSTLTWKLEFHAESDGRITVSIRHAAVGSRPPESLVRFARKLVAGAKAPSASATLELNGVTKPLAAWKRP
jgi:hypothetical protein